MWSLPLENTHIPVVEHDQMNFGDDSEKSEH